eukprot:365907-Chlamydomonas_euryale.AAC.21
MTRRLTTVKLLLPLRPTETRRLTTVKLLLPLRPTERSGWRNAMSRHVHSPCFHFAGAFGRGRASSDPGCAFRPQGRRRRRWRAGAWNLAWGSKGNVYVHVVEAALAGLKDGDDDGGQQTHANFVYGMRIRALCLRRADMRELCWRVVVWSGAPH